MREQAIQSQLDVRVDRINRKLQEELRRSEQLLATIAPELEDIVSTEAEFVLGGGKRIRGLLLQIGYEWHGGTGKAAIDRVAAGIELMHAAVLAHDDIIDRDTHRRGRATLHKVFANGAHAEQRGRSFALLVGDHLATLGYSALLRASFDLETKDRALAVFHEESLKTGMGAALEVDATRRTSLPQERLERAERLKTASYTTLAPLRIGAILAGTTLSETLTKVATLAGEAFQLRDDLLGLTATQSQTGKTAFSDLREGRDTPLLHMMRHVLSAAEQRELSAFLSEEGREDTNKIVALLQRRGVEQLAETEIEKKWNVIEELLEQTKGNNVQKRLLLHLVRRLVYRDA
ncbi:MAG: polyprenyl synthetase family protein [Candidatus Doudnabacteria bacterium]|nr:polyprenyl synthetase family protein [Candidatus Doudnabacteria bacterium]